MKKDVKESVERKEALIRIAVAVVSGIILNVWKYLIIVLGVIHWVYALFAGKRKKEFANLCEIWNTQTYVFLRYLTGVSNERPFPFKNLAKDLSKFEK